MVGLFQLLILFCSLSKTLSTEVVTLLKPLPWELRMAQECKEEAQIVCKECGWAQCVPIVDGKDYYEEFDEYHECCPNVREGHKAYCCPLGYEFKCCAVLPQQKYALQPTDTSKTNWELRENCKKNSTNCICSLTTDGLISGFCCDNSNTCKCCETDPKISKIPAVVRYTAKNALCEAEIVAKALLVGEKVICTKRHNHPATDCCDKGYGLEFDDGKPNRWSMEPRRGKQACENQIKEWHKQSPPSCVWAEGSWNTSECCPENYKLKFQGGHHHTAIKKNVWPLCMGVSLCNFRRIWAIHPIPKLTSTDGLEGKFMWKKMNTAEMVRALDESLDCKKKEVYCACGALHFDQIMNGMCCDSDTFCECCSKDPTISKLPTLARKLQQGKACKDHILHELEIKEVKGEAMCMRQFGRKESKCCDGDYLLVDLEMDPSNLPERFRELRQIKECKDQNPDGKHRKGVKPICEWKKGSKKSECCDEDYDITHMEIDPSNLPEGFLKPRQEQRCKRKIQILHEGEIQEQKKEAVCAWTKGSKESKCCDGDYELTRMEIDPSNLPEGFRKPQQGKACKSHIFNKYGKKQKKEAVCVWTKGSKKSECCDGDYYLSKLEIDPSNLPEGFRKPRQGKACKDQILSEYKRGVHHEAVCEWSKGWRESECCGKDYYFGVADIDPTISKLPERFRKLRQGKACKDQIDYKSRFNSEAVCEWSKGSEESECCGKDYRFSEFRKPRQGKACKDEIFYQFGKGIKMELVCLWSEGWKDESKCCDGDYQLVVMDQRYAEYKIRVTETPFAAIRGFDRHHPFCAARRPMIHLNVCAFEWYWVPTLKDITNKAG